MRTSWAIVLVLAGSGIADAQEVPKPSDRWTLLPGFWANGKSKIGSAKPLPGPFPELRPLHQTCSVPLLRAQIPDDVDYTIVQIPANSDGLAPMPKLGVPPVCEGARFK
jgi:hypothetical protein